ncbi:MAG: hypothetical protein C5B52_13140 [Bacteroidetes bacterium]|nr:MAG: hypothetical protein C5B52_13140 [Bacteroidota bacterium]
MNWKFLKKPWPPILWTAIIFILMTIPGSSIPSHGLFGIPGLDKVVHAVMFGTLVWLWTSWLAAKNPSSKLFIIVSWASLGAIAYGTGMEFFQKYFVPTRSFDVGDILADAVGALIVWVIYWYWLRKKSTNT